MADRDWSGWAGPDVGERICVFWWGARPGLDRETEEEEEKDVAGSVASGRKGCACRLSRREWPVGGTG